MTERDEQFQELWDSIPNQTIIDKDFMKEIWDAAWKAAWKSREEHKDKIF